MAELTRVTITGADNSVEPAALYELSREFGFVEWGILLSRGREGTARYPSAAWRQRFSVPLVGWRPRTALHLCGEAARDVLAGSDLWPDAWHYDRVQLNGFSKYRLPYLRCARFWPENEVILQVQNRDALFHAAELAKLDANVSVLWDKSGGAGHVIREFPAIEGLRMGYAGGLGPENLTERLGHVFENTYATWIDMETGVRTDDRFDLAKVRSVLEQAAPFVSEAARG